MRAVTATEYGGYFFPLMEWEEIMSSVIVLG